MKATRRALRVIGVVAISASIMAANGAATLRTGWRYDGGRRQAMPRPDQPTMELTATAPVISAEQAVTLVVNNLTATDDGYRLSHPRYTAQFTAEGMDFGPRRAGPDWHWKLDFVGTQAGALADVATTPIGPRRESSLLVRYDRGALIEQYVLGGNSIEQQFIIPAPLALEGHDLVVAGMVASGGKLETPAEGWHWRTDTGAVTLGRVSVFDAAGTPLPATMEVTATATRIVVDEDALARAVYPVLIDPEVGVNDFRISDMGPDGSVANGAFSPAVAYNSTNNEYLVVWSGDDTSDEYEIFGQRINAATGAAVGVNDFRISDMGPDGSVAFGAGSPAVAYNVTNNEYLVVWDGDDNTAPVVDEAFEIFGQRLNATGRSSAPSANTE